MFYENKSLAKFSNAIFSKGTTAPRYRSAANHDNNQNQRVCVKSWSCETELLI